MRRLEALLRGSTPPLDAAGKPAWSGLCKRWRSGVALPSDAMCDRAEELTHGAARLRYWRDHVLWRFIAEPNDLSAKQIVEALWKSSEDVKDVLFLRFDSSHPILGEISEWQLEELRGIGSLDAFTALLGLARIAEETYCDERHAVLVASAFSILAPVIRNCPQLQRCSLDLFEVLTVSFWSHWYLNGVRQNFGYDLYLEHAAALTTKGDAKCAVDVGFLHSEGSAEERPLFALDAILGERLC